MRSGDLMRVDEQGFYYFVDRVGDTFRWKGENVATIEVAAALCACAGVVDAAVYGVAVPGAEGRAGMALIAPCATIDLDAIARALCASLPDYARPVFLRVKSSLDVTATFKHQEAGADCARASIPSESPIRSMSSIARSSAYVPLDRRSFRGDRKRRNAALTCDRAKDAARISSPIALSASRAGG